MGCTVNTLVLFGLCEGRC